MKKQLVQFDFKGMTTQQYNQVMDELTNTGHSEIPGRIHHASTVNNDGIQVVGIWESPETFENFTNIAVPIFKKFNVTPVQPTISPVYYEYSGIEEHAN